jgi:3-oxoacyl-[acyl-carrier protein] reductase
MSTVIQSLAGKTAWVTGSSRGIGRVIAEHLAELGAQVAVMGTTRTSSQAFDEAESIDAVAEAIAQAHGVRTLAVWGDLTQEEVVADLVAQIRSQLGEIDILVNCAGGDIGAAGVTGHMGGKPEGNTAIDIGLDDIRMVLDRNLMTCILCCREVAPAMRERREGWIVNIGSIAGLKGNETQAIYSTAKAAVHEYTRCLAALLRPYNVHVNAVAPGSTVTPRFVASRPVDEERMVKEGTLTRYGWPEEIARAVGFLVSEGGSYISGQVLRVDGGEQMWPC